MVGVVLEVVGADRVFFFCFFFCIFIIIFFFFLFWFLSPGRKGGERGAQGERVMDQVGWIGTYVTWRFPGNCLLGMPGHCSCVIFCSLLTLGKVSGSLACGIASP